jgi:predicted Holliday junction resolvase-like endonuclease
MKSARNLLIIAALGTAITVTGCGVQKTDQAKSAQSTAQTAAQETKTFTMNDASNNMRNILKDMKTQVSNNEEGKVSEGGTKLEDSWKEFEDKFEDDLKDKYLDLYVKIEDPLEVIEAASKVKPLDAKVLNESIDKLDVELVKLQKIDATTTGLQNMRNALKEMSSELNNKEEDKAIKTSEKLEVNWKPIEDGIKESNKDLYGKVESPLGAINAGVKVNPLDIKSLTASIDELDKTIEQLQKSIALSTAPQDMKTALAKIKKFTSPVNEEKVTKYAARLEKYWSTSEEIVKQKDAKLYEKIEVPMGAIQSGARANPIDANTITSAIGELDKLLTEMQNLK